MQTSGVHHQASSLYDVFLSFRGADTRKKFTDHLYCALVRNGFRTFRDDEEIRTGETIGSEIEGAIRRSAISVIVLSKDYASSKWCLTELMLIMKQRETGHHVIPIFYDVEPSQVKHQSHEYAEAFAEHEKRLEGDRRVEEWKKALRDIAELRGHSLGDRHEAVFIEEIVKEIRKKLDKQILHVPSDVVGRKQLVNDINYWLQSDPEVNIATISGIGGIGKTTISKIVYNSNYHKFEGSSFLANVGETSRAFRGLVLLQMQLLSDLLNEKGTNVWNVDEGLMKIKAVVCSRRVLIVLDDVDDFDQYKAIIGESDWLPSGSKIIITTRKKQLMMTYGTCQRFEVRELSSNESLQLFSRHAFGKDYPTQRYRELALRVSEHCSGLPLALKTIGSSLSGKSPELWKSTLGKLEVIVDHKIQTILVMSYDLLADDHDRRLFLDIACFFTGKDKDYTVTILEGCGFHVASGIQNLIDHNLLFISSNNEIGMHPLIRDMGREIIRQESPDDPGKRSRLWRYEDVLDVLRTQSGSEIVKGISIDMRRPEDGNLWKINTVPVEGLTTNAFENMGKLKLLQIDYAEARGTFKKMPKSLVWLSWHGFPHQYISEDFCLANLVALEMSNSMLKHNWKSHRIFRQLKFLDLSHNNGLVKTPDLKGLPSLERLVLKHCKKLAKVDDSIQFLLKLRFLSLSNCPNLRKLPRKVCVLECLEELDLSYCSELEDLPMEVFQMQSLSSLCLDGVSINISKSPFHEQQKFSLPTQSWHSVITSLLVRKRISKPIALQKACISSSLVHLSLKYCGLSDDIFARIDFCGMVSLKELNLSGNPIHQLPDGIGSLENLQDLILNNCKELQSISEVPMSLKIFQARCCESLERVAEMPFNVLPGFFLGCKKLANIKGVVELTPMIHMDRKIISLLGLCEPKSITNLQFELYNYHGGRIRKGPLQVVHESGISSFFVPGCSIPHWYTYHGKQGAISFEVPSHNTGLKVSGLNICIKVDGHSGAAKLPIHFPSIILINETKKKHWKYIPSFWGIPKDGEDMTWFAHWGLRSSHLVLDGTDFHEGDLVHVRVLEGSRDGIDLHDGFLQQVRGLDGNKDDSDFHDVSLMHLRGMKVGATRIGVDIVYEDGEGGMVNRNNVGVDVLYEDDVGVGIMDSNNIDEAIEHLLQDHPWIRWFECLPCYPEATYTWIGGLAFAWGFHCAADECLQDILDDMPGNPWVQYGRYSNYD